MKKFVWLLAFACAATSASAQEWLTSPTPAVPVHVPVTPPPAVAPSSPPPAVAPRAPATSAPHPADAVQRLLDPYGLATVPASIAPLSSRSVAPTAMLGPIGAWLGPSGDSAVRLSIRARCIAPPVIAFPNMPIAWFFGF